jgi:hypothetical protein
MSGLGSFRKQQLQGERPNRNLLRFKDMMQNKSTYMDEDLEMQDISMEDLPLYLTSHELPWIQVRTLLCILICEKRNKRKRMSAGAKRVS